MPGIIPNVTVLLIKSRVIPESYEALTLLEASVSRRHGTILMGHAMWHIE